MADNALHKVIEQAKENRRRNRWNKVVTGMAAFVVFCTTYALILPAITEERQPLCGLEEHVHTDKCWEKPRILTCPYQKMAEEGSLPLLVHTHDENCYDLKGDLVCALPEVESHVHDYRCYTDVTPEAPHVHTDECYAEERTLTCTLEESQGHAHGEGCYDENGELICPLEESEGHTHADECYAIEKKLVCGSQEATEEELAAYTGEPEKLLACGKDEVILHQHTEECRDQYGNLTCELNELYAHQHGKECWTRDPDAEKILTCGLEEHTHDDTCYTDLEADLETPEMWEAILPEPSGDWPEDLLAVALTQLGYEQSRDNVTLTPEGLVLNYTRYGQWAGAPYGPWALNFLDFCHHYAGIPGDAFPVHEGQPRWCEQLKEENWNIYFTPDQYAPVPGDTVFLDLNVDGTMDAAAIAWEYQEATEEAEASLTLIQGDADGAVAKRSYAPGDPVILGYASLAAARSRWELLNPAPEPEPARYCGLDEHTHTESCYDAEETLICELPEHTHTEACLAAPVVYYCGLEEHTHDENCYDNAGALTCTLEEHTHEALCRVESPYCCGLEEHAHTEDCYNGENILICGLEAHAHTDQCRLAQQTLDAVLPQTLETEQTAAISVSGLLPRDGTVTAVPVEVEGMLFAFDITITNALGRVFEPVIPVEVTFYLPGITDNPELDLEACHIDLPDGSSQTLEIQPLATRTGETGTIQTDVPRFSAVGVRDLTRAVESVDTEHHCDLDDFLNEFPECSEDHPFGGANNFNVFLLGDLKGWGHIHGNAAIAGDIIESKGTIGYFAGSSFDYSADSTKANSVSLVLGGHVVDCTGAVQVANGTIIMRDTVQQETEIDLDNHVNPNVDHYHKVHVEEPDPDDPGFTMDPFVYYFAQARGESDYKGSLKEHNMHVYQYAIGKMGNVKEDGHLGEARPLTKADGDRIDLVNIPKGAIILHGENQFYNVFNLTPDQYAKVENQSHPIYLDTPPDSYTIINIIPPSGADDGSKEPTETLEDFSIQLWYRTAHGWKDQPAEKNVDKDYNQTQMTLVNFAPSIKQVDITKGGDYLYASILGPNVTLDATTDKGGYIDLHGTIVLDNMYGAGNSHAITNPFLTGTTVNLTKQTKCDHPDDKTAHDKVYANEYYGENANSKADVCQIDRTHGMSGNAWAGYYADLLFERSAAPGKPGVFAIERMLPLDGSEPLKMDGLSPGNYQVVDEVVYKIIGGNRVTADERGYPMLLTYPERLVTYGTDEPVSEENYNADHWILTYCKPIYDEKQNFTNYEPTDLVYGETLPTEQELADAGVQRTNSADFFLFGHYWNYAAFKSGSRESPFFTVQSGAAMGTLTLVNHYDIRATENVVAYKTWGEMQTITTVVDTVTTTEQKWIPVQAPDNAKIQVTLYQSIDNGPFKKLEPTEEIPNPVTLSNENDWHTLWAGLPQKDAGHTYTYKVEETEGWPGFTSAEPEPGANGVWTIKNTRQRLDPGSLKVNKEWYNDDGTVMTPEEIAAKSGLRSNVTLYQVKGMAVDAAHPTEENLRYIKTVSLYIGDHSEGNRIATIPYVTADNGSDLNISATFWVKGQYTQDSGFGGIKNIQLRSNVKYTGFALTPTGTASDTGYYTEITVTAKLRFVKDNVLLLLTEPSLSDDADKDDKVYEIVRDTTGLPEAVETPGLGVYEVRFDPGSIDWEDEMKPYTAASETTSSFVLEGTSWDKTWNNLPLYDTQYDNDPNATDAQKKEGFLTRYGYYVVEDPLPEGYKPKYIYSATGAEHDGSFMENNMPNDDGEILHPNVPGVVTGFITIRNYPVPPGGPELPMTGGIGTIPYTLGGLLAVILAGFLMLYNKPRRKEVPPSDLPRREGS